VPAPDTHLSLLAQNALVHRYFAIHKPGHMLSQFIGGAPGLHMLGELEFDFPEGTHAVGRLDYHSEGLLLLTTNSKVTKLLFESSIKHKRTYLVQAYKVIGQETLEGLRNGVTIRVAGGVDYVTTACEVQVVPRPEGLPPGRFEVRADLPSTWLTITLTEGKYRQIRKMLQAIGHPCRRLVRLSIEDLALGDLAAGAVREMIEEEFFGRLRIPYPVAMP
jgi:23S rRNA pseudouridine2457 synthase